MLLRFVITFSILSISEGKKEGCSWCAAPATSLCDQDVEVEKDTFWLSISHANGNRIYPYWRPVHQASIGSRGNEKISLVIIVQHGTDRNGDDYTQYMAGAVKKSNVNAMVYGMQMYFLGDDGLDAENEIYWDDTESPASNWKWGGDSTADLPARISSFQVLDEIVSAIKAVHPETRILLAGHSAGGQVVQRYALFSPVGTDFFAPANPSSLTYLDERRPSLPDFGTCQNMCKNTTIANTLYEFGIPHNPLCSNYNDYGYGLNNLQNASSYISHQSSTTERKDEMIQRYMMRSVDYFSGQSDICNELYAACDSSCRMHDEDMDRSCPAEMQGKCRYERLTAFSQYVNASRHRLIPVPQVGHNACGIFQSNEFTESLEALATTSSQYDWFCIPKRDAYCSASSTFVQEAILGHQTTSGTVLMGGGTDVDDAFEWQIARGGSGTFLVLRESGTNAYDSYLLRLGASVAATLILNERRAAEDAFVLEKVQNADAIFFAGGDQSKYVSRIQNTTLEALLRNKSKSISIGGTSAGNAIQGLYIYKGAFGSAVSSECLENPYNYHIDLGPALLESPPLDFARVLMDDHFVTRDRMGRMLTFMARLLKDGLCTASTVRGIGVDEATALLVDHDSGIATLVGNSTAFACEAPFPQVCTRGEPLTLTNITCQRLSFGDSFDLYAWNGTGYSYSLDIVKGRILSNEPYGG